MDRADTSMKDPELQIVVVSGPEDIQRATFGFASALAAGSSGIDVAIVLSMRGAYWAAPHASQGSSVPEFPDVETLLQELAELEVPVLACSTCVDNYCPSPTGGDGLRTLRKGIQRIGLGLVAIRMASARTIVC